MTLKVLITGATGDTGRAAVEAAIAIGLDARAMVHKKDARSEALEKRGVEVALGDHLEIDTLRAAMEGVDAAYFVWPVAPGLIAAIVISLKPRRRPASRPSSTSRNAPPTDFRRAIPAATVTSPSK
jgi:NADPH:quinone reductase-like Zn-dependent oxidoreductase